MNDMCFSKLALHVGRTKQMMNEGLTIAEIAKVLRVTEEDVEGYIDVIRVAESMK